MSTDRFKELFFSFLNSTPPDRLQELVTRFWNRKKKRMRKKLCDRLQQRIDDGYQCLVITASPEWIVAPLVREMFGLETLGTVLHYENGHYRLKGRNCKGTEKVRRFEERFGAAPVVWHSSLKSTERRRAWRAIASGDAQVVVGARSALFLPYDKLGLIVVDEAHEISFKQDEGVRYNARDVAVMRARFERIPIIPGINRE